MSDPLTEVPAAHLAYALDQGAVPAWLVAGPVVTPRPDWAQGAGPDARAAIVAAAGAPARDLAPAPVEWGEVGAAYGDLRWKIVPTGSDHLLDLAATTEACAHVVAWAYAQLVVPEASEVVFTVTTYSPVELWIDGELIASSHRFYDGAAGKLVFPAALRAGVCALLLRLQTVALGPTPLAVGVRLHTASAVSVRLPTSVTPVSRRQTLADLMNAAYLTRDVFVRGEPIDLWWPKSMQQRGELTARLQRAQDRIVAEAAPLVEAGARAAFGDAKTYRPGEYEIRLLPELDEYYVEGVRVERRLPLAIVHAAHSNGLYGDLASRRVELWREVAAGRDLWAALAKLYLGETERVPDEAIDAALVDVAEARTTRYERLMALIRLLTRHAAALSGDKLDAVRTGLRQAYGRGPALIPVHPTPAQAILAAAVQLLIAEQLPSLRAEVRGQGATLREMLLRYAAGEWAQVNDGEAMAQLFMALAHVVDLASDADLVDLAAVCLDKLCFELALNSYQGIPGGGQTAAVVRRLQSGRLHPLGGVCRLLWGAGAFCPPYAAAMSVACAEAYTMPEVVIAAALDQTIDAWSTLCYGVGETIRQAIYRTPDYLLGSLVDYRPGAPGARETVVQAILAPEAMVWINHPIRASQHEAYAPNFWRGNGCLPRVGQWRDAALVLFNLPQDGTPLDEPWRMADQSPFTHAYCPLAAFDEVAHAGEWLCARKGNSYLALTAAQGLDCLETGPTARREVRSPGRRNVWIVQMGRAAVHGSFADFTAAIRSLRPDYRLAGSADADGPAVVYTNLQGDVLAMDWAHGLRVNGKDVGAGMGAHVASPYGRAPLPATHLDLTFQTYVLRLALGAEQPDTM